MNHYQLYDPYKKQGVQARSETALAHLVYYFDHKPYIMQWPKSENLASLEIQTFDLLLHFSGA